MKTKKQTDTDTGGSLHPLVRRQRVNLILAWIILLEGVAGCVMNVQPMGVLLLAMGAVNLSMQPMPPNEKMSD